MRGVAGKSKNQLLHHKLRFRLDTDASSYRKLPPTPDVEHSNPAHAASSFCDACAFSLLPCCVAFPAPMAVDECAVAHPAPAHTRHRRGWCSRAANHNNHDSCKSTDTLLPLFVIFFRFRLRLLLLIVVVLAVVLAFLLPRAFRSSLQSSCRKSCATEYTRSEANANITDKSNNKNDKKYRSCRNIRNMRHIVVVLRVHV